MRLIDADGIKFEEDCSFSGKGLNEFIKAIPTAYDVDKVVEQLEELPEKIYGEISEDEGSGYYYNAYREGIQRAIEIVKSGIKE